MNLLPERAPFLRRLVTQVVLGLLAISSAALMAYPGSAPATGITTTTGGAAATPTIHAVSEGGHVKLANSNSNIECASTVEGNVESHGSANPAEGALSKLEFTGCTNGWTVEVNAKGTLGVTWTSGHNGTVTSTGATVTGVVHTIFGDITCRYETKETDIGTLTGGNPATLKITASIPFHSGGGLCGSGSSGWSGSYATTSALYVANEPNIVKTGVTTTTGGPAATPTIHAVSEGGHVKLANSNSNIECASTVEGNVESHGSANPAEGALSKLEFTGCTNGWTVEVNAKGTLGVTWTSGHNGTVTSTGATVTAVVHTIFGDIECRYSTNNTDIGTLTGGSPATLKITATIPFHSGGGVCGSGSSAWSGNYVTTSALYVAETTGTFVSTTTGGAAATPTIHAVSEGGHLVLEHDSNPISCASTLEGKVISHGEGSPAVVSISHLTFTGCTEGWTVTVNAGGTFSVISTSGHSGTLTSSGATVTAVYHSMFGDITCRYLTNSTDIGTVTGGNPATVKITGWIPYHSGGGLCGTGSVQWSGSYVTTSPLWVEGLA